MHEAIDALPELKSVLSLEYKEIQKRYDGKRNTLAVSLPPSVDPGPWTPKTFEDHLLHEYWKQVGGLIYAEVEVGNSKRNTFWMKGSKSRFFDGVRLPSSDDWEDGIHPFARNKSEFSERVVGQPVELIEIKGKLNRPVIGQALAGYDMFKKDYPSGKITNVVICKVRDPALEWVCKRRNIVVKFIEWPK